MLQPNPPWATISDSSTISFVWYVAPMGQVIRRISFASCEKTKYSVPSLTSAVESSDAIMSVAPSPPSCLLGINFRFHEGLPADFKYAGGKPSLIILDDLLSDAYSKDVCDLFRKASYQRNISVILITQNLFH